MRKSLRKMLNEADKKEMAWVYFGLVGTRVLYRHSRATPFGHIQGYRMYPKGKMEIFVKFDDLTSKWVSDVSLEVIS